MSAVPSIIAAIVCVGALAYAFTSLLILDRRNRPASETLMPTPRIGAHIAPDPVKLRSVAVTFDELLAGPTSELLVEPLNPKAPHGPIAAHRARMAVALPPLQAVPRDDMLAKLRAAFRRPTEAAA